MEQIIEKTKNTSYTVEEFSKDINDLSNELGITPDECLQRIKVFSSIKCLEIISENLNEIARKMN